MVGGRRNTKRSIVLSVEQKWTERSKSMNKRIKKKKLKQWVKNNVKVAYSIQPLDNGNCKLYATIKEQEHESEDKE